MKKYNLSIAVIALLNSSQATRLSYRPPEGTTPWHEENFREHFGISPDFPNGYTVPNFGVDEDIADTQNHLQEAESLLHVTMKAEFHKPAPIPDLTRPNFGDVEHDVAISLKHTKLAEKENKHKLRSTFPAPEVIPDLTRPNYGSRDEEVAVTQSNIELAEGLHQATLHAEFDHGTPIPDLTRPNFGDVEHDVAISLKHTNLAEK